MKRLLVFLTDPLKAFQEKGEIKARYYNPENVFSEVHFVSPITRDVAVSYTHLPLPPIYSV